MSDGREPQCLLGQEENPAQAISLAPLADAAEALHPFEREGRSGLRGPNLTAADRLRAQLFEPLYIARILDPNLSPADPRDKLQLASERAYVREERAHEHVISSLEF